VKPHRRTQRLVAARHRLERDAAAPGAEDDRRDHDVQPVEAAGREERRHRVRAALDHDAAEAALGERRQDRGRRDRAIGRRQAYALDPARQRGPRALRRDRQAADAVVGEHARIGVHPAARIDHGARRRWPADVPHGELRIIGQRGADPDHDHVDQRAQPMQMGESGGPVDVVGMTGLGGDAAVERLAELPDDDQIVDGAGLERPEPLLPGGRQRPMRPEHFRNHRPAGGLIGRCAVRRAAIVSLEPEILRCKWGHHAQ